MDTFLLLTLYATTHHAHSSPDSCFPLNPSPSLAHSCEPAPPLCHTPKIVPYMNMKHKTTHWQYIKLA